MTSNDDRKAGPRMPTDQTPSKAWVIFATEFAYQHRHCSVSHRNRATLARCQFPRAHTVDGAGGPFAVVSCSGCTVTLWPSQEVAEDVVAWLDEHHSRSLVPGHPSHHSTRPDGGGGMTTVKKVTINPSQVSHVLLAGAGWHHVCDFELVSDRFQRAWRLRPRQPRLLSSTISTRPTTSASPPRWSRSSPSGRGPHEPRTGGASAALVPQRASSSARRAGPRAR